MVLEWKWETAVPELSPITEGPAWDGRYLWFVYTAIDGIMRFDPETGEYCVAYYHSNGCGGLTFDSEGRLYGAEGGTRPPLIDHSGIRRIARYEKDGSRTTITDRLNGRRLNGPNDVIVDSKGRVWFSDPVANIEEVPRRLGPDTKPQQLTHSSLLPRRPTARRRLRLQPGDIRHDGPEWPDLFERREDTLCNTVGLRGIRAARVAVVSGKR